MVTNTAKHNTNNMQYKQITCTCKSKIIKKRTNVTYEPTQ